jgi:L-threonylcarbamoyladenylate synthase
MTVSPPEILRPGVVTQDALEAVLDTPVNLHPGLKTEGDGSRVLSPAADDGATEGDGAAPRSPGMKYRHYAPKAQMLVVEGAREKVRAELDRLKAMNEALGLRVGILPFEERGYLEAAHGFYAELRALDDEGVDLIIAGALPETDGVGFAVMNRMMKAAGYNIVHV